MNKHLITVLSVTGALFVASVVGYVLPKRAESNPARVLMDNTGGRVVFSHMVHAEDYGLECTECHHDSDGGMAENERPESCSVCHPASYDGRWVAWHQTQFKDKRKCLRCHVKDPSGGVSPEERPDLGTLPTQTEAFHEQCMGCHEDMGGPAGENTCKACHAGI